MLSLVSSVVTILNWDRFVRYFLAQAEAQGQLDTTGTNIDTEEFANLILRFGVVVQIVTVALYLLFIWFAWRGYNWARIVLAIGQVLEAD